MKLLLITQSDNMLKLRKDGAEYEVLGHITFKPNEDEETVQTNYTIVLDGETITIESTDTSYEVFEAPDPEPVVEVVVEPEPVEPAPDPEPTVEELERIAWLEQWHVYVKANQAMKALAEAGFEPTTEETTRFNTLKNWVGANRKPEYSQFI